MYSDAEAANLYNRLNPWDASDESYVPLGMAAASVLDVGCGTGGYLHRLRDEGHRGRLVGVDPDTAALDVARHRTGVEWVEGTAASMRWMGEFEQAVMMSNAFQCLVTDEELATSLAAIRRALVDGGRFTFATRNPEARAWETWTPDNAQAVVDDAGRPLRIIHQVEALDGDVVTLTETTADPDGTALRVDRARLRFLDAGSLDRFLADAGFSVESRHGGWSGEPFTASSATILTSVRAV